MYNFVQKTNATKQLWLHFIPINFATEFFHTVFTRISLLNRTLTRDQKVIFVKVQFLAL